MGRPSATPWWQIAAFANDARRAGARVVIADPNFYVKSMGTRNGPFLDELRSRAGRLGIAVVGAPEDSLFGDDRVWDARYHSTSEGQLVNT